MGRHGSDVVPSGVNHARWDNILRVWSHWADGGAVRVDPLARGAVQLHGDLVVAAGDLEEDHLGARARDAHVCEAGLDDAQPALPQDADLPGGDDAHRVGAAQDVGEVGVERVQVRLVHRELGVSGDSGFRRVGEVGYVAEVRLRALEVPRQVDAAGWTEGSVDVGAFDEMHARVRRHGWSLQ